MYIWYDITYNINIINKSISRTDKKETEEWWLEVKGNFSLAWLKATKLAVTFGWDWANQFNFILDAKLS